MNIKSRPMRLFKCNSIFWTLLLLAIFIPLQSQTFSLTYKLTTDEETLAEFMDMKGFSHHEFDLRTNRSVFINVYIEEFEKDSLIKKYDHFSDTISIPREYYQIAFPKTNGKHFRIRVFGSAEGDSIEKVRFRMGAVAVEKKLHIDKSKFDYDWKIANFDDSNKPQILHIDERVPLLYYTSPVKQGDSGKEVQIYCETSDIIDNRTTDKRIKTISHYFILGIQLTDKL